jgi:transketolase
VIRDGADVVLFAYGPVMLHQVLSAADTLAANGIGTRVVNMPWLNEPDVNWLEEIVGATQAIACVDDHAPVGGLASALLAAFSQSPLSGRRFLGMGVEGIPVCGTPDEALAAHGLDGTSLARRIGDWLQHHE